MALVFALLFTVVQASVLMLVDRVGLNIARERNVEELRVGERVFLRLLDQNGQRLLQAAEVLSKDFAFRQAVATGDAPTISSVLKNHGTRIQADVMMLVSLDNMLTADSLHALDSRRPFPHPRLIHAAQEDGKASAIMRIDDHLYQVVVVPVLAPDPIAWVTMGFSIDKTFVDDLRALTAMQVSFLEPAPNHGWRILATTRPEAELKASLSDLTVPLEPTRSPLQLGGFDTLVTPLAGAGGESIEVALQRSVTDGLEPFDRLKSLIGLLTLASIVACVIGSAILARHITRPLAMLSRFASRVRDGDYRGRLTLHREDEVGALSDSFNHMLDGIEGRQAEILRLAYEDAVTGLPNRAQFSLRLTEAVEAYRRDGTPLAVVLMDLDRFKFINDTLGHQAGDLVLQAVARRLRESLRESDTVARLGGDEFAILLTGGDQGRAPAVGRMVQAILEEPIDLDGQAVDVGSSIGIAQCPMHGEDPSVLLRHADIAMYEAKRDQSGVAIYEARLDRNRAENLSLMSDLRRAIAEDQLVLHYQPKIDLRRGQLVGVEALVRWMHPERGMIAPSEFVPFAERTGMIRHITLWVIEHATRQCGAWLANGLSLSVSLNVSSRDLLQRDLPQLFAAATRRHEVPSELITVEVTESALVEDPQRAQDTIRGLKEQGFRISIDDYGTGYSSLAYIQRLHCDELKVDRAFVTHAAGDGKDAAIVHSTIELGHSLGLTVVAEGVEDQEVMEVLRKLGCDLAQGYAISRPLPAETLATWIATCEWTTKPARASLIKVADRLRAV
jgi:diguanylate cyclase (GGDEF)-like protein